MKDLDDKRSKKIVSWPVYKRATLAFFRQIGRETCKIGQEMRNDSVK